MSNTTLAFIPALYAWQLYDWGIGAGAYAVVVLLLAAASWTFILKGWPLKRLGSVRTTIIIVSMIAIGISAAERCDIGGKCARVF